MATSYAFTNRIGNHIRLTRISDNATRAECAAIRTTITINENLEVIIDGLCVWESGSLLQQAFPTLTSSEREFLLTGMTDEMWDQLESV